LNNTERGIEKKYESISRLDQRGFSLNQLDEFQTVLSNVVSLGPLTFLLNFVRSMLLIRPDLT